MKKQTKAIAATLLIFVVAALLAAGSLKLLSLPGYLTGTQGLQADFNSVHWGTQDLPADTWWSASEKPSKPLFYRRDQPVWPSMLSFGYELDFDPDGASIGMPDLCATQQPFTVDMDVEPKSYVWNYKNGSETLANGTTVDVYTQFEMYRYKLTWAINLWLSGSEWEADGKYDDLNGFNYHLDCNGAYRSGELWIRLVPRAFVYFKDNPDTVYFAPAYIGVDEIQWVGINKDGTKIVDDPDIVKIEDIIPKARGETLGIYYQRGGAPVDVQTALLSYQGQMLDPEIFRGEYWIRIILNEFKAKSWTEQWEPWIHNWKYPSVNIKFYVYEFVVGTWTVYIQTGEVPKLEPHLPIVSVTPGLFDWLVDWWNGAMQWLSNPFNQLWIFLIIIVVVIVVVSVASPGLWTALAQRKSNSKG